MRSPARPESDSGALVRDFLNLVQKVPVPSHLWESVGPQVFSAWFQEQKQEDMERGWEVVVRRFKVGGRGSC